MSDAAHRIYVDALSYCSECKTLTGFLSNPETEAFVRGRKKSMAVVAELVSLGAWEQGPDGYLIHDFEHYVPPRSQPAIIEWRSNKRAEWNLIGNQSASNPDSISDYMPIVPGQPVARSPEPVPDGSKEPPYPPVENYGIPTYGIPRVGMHVSETAPLSKILGTLRIQSTPCEEAS
jgi:hypothetical protein